MQAGVRIIEKTIKKTVEAVFFVVLPDEMLYKLNWNPRFQFANFTSSFDNPLQE